MSTSFSKLFFINNRRRLQTLFTGTAPIILTAHGLLQRNNDVTYPFRQDSNFWYLTGIDDPDIILVIDRSREYLIVPDRDESRIAFDGQVDYQALIDRSGVKQVYGEKEGWARLSAKIKKVKHVATIGAPKSYESALGIYTNPARSRLIERVKSHNPDIEMLDIRQHVTIMRMIKQPEEVAAIKEAIRITSNAFKHVHKRIASTGSEVEIQKLLDASFAKDGVGHAYQPIIASGRNACTLHYVDNNQPINKGDLLLIDAGSEYDHYASDITRTYATGAVNKRQQDVYDAVIEVQEYACGLLKPGAIIRENERKIEHFMGEKLRELGLIKAINTESVRSLYPHATSHHLGLDTHDVADYDRPLEPGMVLTVEPGIYISSEQIGIRIEDDVMITEQGVVVLSKSLSKQLV